MKCNDLNYNSWIDYNIYRIDSNIANIDKSDDKDSIDNKDNKDIAIIDSIDNSIQLNNLYIINPLLLPSPQSILLYHSNNMTPTLSKFYNSDIYLNVLIIVLNFIS